MIVLLAFIAYAVYFVVAEASARRFKIGHELSRKVEHLLFGVSLAWLPSLLTFHQIAVLGIFFIPVVLISKSFGLFGSIHLVKRKTNGELYFAVVIVVMALLFPHREVFSFAMLVLGLGDGAAALIGQPFGTHKYRLFGARKSYEGSAAFFIVTAALGLVFGVSLPASITVAAILTTVEGALTGGLDNLLLPPVAALLMRYFL